MSDDLNQPGDEGQASNTPLTTSNQPDLDSVITRAVTEALKGVDSRFTGFQSLIDRKFGEISKDVGRLRKAALPPEDADAEADADLQREIEALRQQNQMLQLRRDHPEAVDFLMDLFGEDRQSFEAQIAFIESKFGPKAAQQVEEAVEAAADAIASNPVDPNNPARAKDVALSTATAMARTGKLTEESAMTILRNAGRGSLAKR